MKLAQSMVELGRLLASRDRIPEAMRCYSRAIEVDPEYAGAYQAMGDALYDIGSYWEAASEYRDSLIVEPANPDVLTTLARCYARIEEYGEARASLLHALELEPGHMDALRELALIDRARAA